MGENLHWRFLSHLSLNYLSLARTENFKALLELYLFPDTRDQKTYLANRKRLDGLERVVSQPANKLVSGIMMRGQDIRLTLRQDHFTGRGDVFLFSSVLNAFLGNYASINAFTQFTVEESLSGEEYRWPARLGDRPLI
jgi:type VI secretion system protein ImpG